MDALGEESLSGWLPYGGEDGLGSRPPCAGGLGKFQQLISVGMRRPALEILDFCLYFNLSAPETHTRRPFGYTPPRAPWRLVAHNKKG